MRLDKYLKVSRLIKRREAAKEFIDRGYVRLNSKIAKPSTEVKEGDIIEISAPSGRSTKVVITEIKLVSTIESAARMYTMVDDYEQKK